jgi:hypothetical protein
MNNPEKYRQHAQECFDAAQKIHNADEGAILLNIAQTWLRFAIDRPNLEPRKRSRQDGFPPSPGYRRG